MKDDVRTEPQRLETSFFMRKHDRGGHSNAQGDEYIRNLADLLKDYGNWACKFRIGISHVEFKVVTKKL